MTRANPGKGTRKAAHVVLKPPSTLACLHCGETYELSMPAPVSVVSAASRAFSKEHKPCKLGSRGTACAHCFGFGHAPDECPNTRYGGSWRAWLAGPDTGISSMTICRRLSGANFAVAGGTCHPWDPDDFGRCHRLLHAIPGWRARIGEMSAESPEWAALAGAWDELEQLYLDELPSGRAPRLWARMQALRVHP